MISYIIITLIVIALISTFFWYYSRFKINSKIKNYEKRINFAILGGDERLSKDLIFDAVSLFFEHKAYYSIIRGFDVKGIRNEINEFNNFKGKLFGKLNSMLLNKGLNPVNFEESSKFEKNFFEKLNYREKNSYKNEKMNIDIFNKIVEDYKNILKKELFS
jgi:hypothetical protein